LTLSGKDELFWVDLLAFNGNQKLDQVLTSIFTNKKTTIVTFKNSLSDLKKKLLGMKFLNNISNFANVLECFNNIYSESSNSDHTLKYIIECLFDDRKLCT
jgi:hypothetical protein